MLKYSQSRYGEELPQLVAADFLAGPGWPRHLGRLRQALRRQRQQMAEAVAAHFPSGTRLSLPEGGMLLWVELPGAVSSESLFDAALAQGIKLAPGSMFSSWVLVIFSKLKPLMSAAQRSTASPHSARARTTQGPALSKPTR